MFAFLQKKIAVPANSTAFACGWDHYEGWLAIGSNAGFLKLKNVKYEMNAIVNKIIKKFF